MPPAGIRHIVETDIKSVTRMKQVMQAKQGSMEEYQRVLEEKVAELSMGRRRTEEIVIERVADSMDDVVLANQRELALEAINRETQVLQQALEALRRIRTGSYGICAECGEGISPRRLSVLPWAGRCLECQESADRRSGTDKADPWNLFSSAA